MQILKQQATQLRATHKTFTYQSYSWELLNNSDLKLTFIYKISPDIFFNPTVTIHNVTQEMIQKIGKDAIDTYAFTIGLAELYSYWKTTTSPEIVIQAGKLSPEAINFWHKLLLKGMGEFFYQNNIDFSAQNFVNFRIESNKEHSTSRALASQENASFSGTKSSPTVLVPVGGGKDSATTLELLKKKYTVGTYIVSTPQSAQHTIDVSRIPQERQIKITRTIDPKIFELNEAGYLNGHVPISAYLAFLSLLTADLFGYTHVAISNERSSNEGNVWYCDQEINHQYSKSYEFEKDFQQYVKTYLPEQAPFYFSFLRPLYELQIAQIFAQFPDHHPTFRSCNKGQKQNAWCCHCSKCLFAWTILFPFLGEDRLTAYFGKNLFESEELWQTTKELLGIAETKPFDCVGTHEETIAAFYLCIQTYEKNHKNLPILLKKVKQELDSNPKLQTGQNGDTDYAVRAQKIFASWNEDNSLPKEFADILKTELESSKRMKQI